MKDRSKNTMMTSEEYYNREKLFERKSIKDQMIDEMNADQEAKIAKRIKTGRRCLNCAYNKGLMGCPESSGENDYCDYFSIPANKLNNEN